MNLFNVYPRFEITLTRANGVFVYDEKNREILDLYGGHGVISIGHNHSYYKKMISDQLNQIGYYSNSVVMPIQNKLAKILSKQSGYPDYNLFLCNSGAEANENALKLASFHTGKKKVIAYKGSFHGRTAATLNVTDNDMISAPINRGNFDVTFIDINDKLQLSKALQTDDVCAVIVEGIQGVGGLDTCSIDYFKYISKKCKEHNALLILDEIQSGYCRTGDFFAHQIAGIKADLITMAKGMGNGFPIAGVLIHPNIQAKYGMLGTTFGGNHLACAAGIAVLDTLKEDTILQNVKEVSDYLIDELKIISAIKNIKGRGLMLGIAFDFPVKEMRLKLLMEYNIFTGGSSNPNLLRILPPLCITVEEIKPFVQALKSLVQ